MSIGRFRGVIAGALAVMSVATSLLIVPTGASAGPTAPDLQITARNGDVVGHCKQTIQSYNTATVSTTIRLSGSAQPATFAGYGTNNYTQVHCYVYGGFNSTSPLLTEIDPFRNSASVPNTSVLRTIPFYPNYTLCGWAYTKKKNGTDSSTAVACMTG